MAIIHVTTSCALIEIDSLGLDDTPEKSMLDVCKWTFESSYYTKEAPHPKRVGSFLVFSEAVEHDGVTPHGAKRKYGEDFKDFIIEHGLGDVWVSPIKANEAYHPGHSNRVYIWNPDRNKLCEWWLARKPVKPIIRIAGADFIKDNLAAATLKCSCGLGLSDTYGIVNTDSKGKHTLICVRCIGDVASADTLLKGQPVNGWLFLKWNRDAESWVCSSITHGGGCGRSLQRGNNVLVRYVEGSRSGDVVCHRCVAIRSDEIDRLTRSVQE